MSRKKSIYFDQLWANLQKEDQGKQPSLLLSYVWGLLMMVVVTTLLYPIKSFLGPVNIAMIYLLPVLFTAARWGMIPAFAAAAAGVITFDFFFVPPAYSFSVADIRYIITFAIFLIVGLITGTLSKKLKQQIIHSRQGEARVAALYTLSRDIAAVSDLDVILSSIVHKVAESIEAKVAIMLPDNVGKLATKAYSEQETKSFVNESEMKVAEWSFERGLKAGRWTENFGDAEGLYLPLHTELGISGILAVYTKVYFQPEQVRLLEAFVGLAALAINRVKLTEQAREALTYAESERLRTALFNSLSHDLRTPLASIIGAVTGLLEENNVYSPSAQRDLLQTIYQGAIRMSRFVNNLLDMARLESGLLELNKEWYDVQDIIGVAVSRMGETLNNRPLKTQIEPDLPLIQADFTLIEQVLINLLDNALKYSEPASEISVAVRQFGKQLAVTVADRGQQIPEEDLSRVFDKFYRLKSPLQVSGTGLGLAICKGLIEAHGGSIRAENNNIGGVSITFVLPMNNDYPSKTPSHGEGDADGK